MDMHFLIRELFPIKLGAIYPSKQAAETAANSLRPEAFSGVSVAIVAPHDPDEKLSKALEKKDWGKGFPFIKAHAAAAMFGALLGAIVASVMIAVGPMLTQNNPIFTYIAFMYVSAMLGMMAAGFFAFRLDQDPLTYKSLDAKHNGKWVVFYQGKDKNDAQRAKRILEEGATKVLQTF